MKKIQSLKFQKLVIIIKMYKEDSNIFLLELHKL